MNCPQVQEKMMDVLYAELLDSRLCFEFFRHLTECRDCNREYMELVETRGMLSEWKVEERFEADQRPFRGAASAASFSDSKWRGGLAGLRPLLQRAAAVVLMVIGALTLLQQTGFSVGGEPLVYFTESELQRYIDAAVEKKQETERERIHMALQAYYEDLRSEQYQLVRHDLEEFQLYLRQAFGSAGSGPAQGLKRIDDR